MTLRPVALFILCLMVLTLAPSRPALAQDTGVWVQIEAQPSLAEAQERALAYSSLFPETSGFQLRSGWYGIMIGPFSAAEADLRLERLKREGLIPEDSFIAYERNFGLRFWPPGGAIAPQPEPLAETAPEIVAVPEPAEIPDETRAEARDSEALLTEGERKDLQVALQWFGFYNGAIDGAFGPGTRNSMAAWQEAQGVLEVTGVLTSRQRAELLQGYRDQTASFGFAEVVEAEAGITVTLPLGLVEFDHYEPPFVHFRAKSPDAPRIVLISQPGDQAALSGLYDVLQTLEAVPLTGERNRDERSFRIRATSATVDTTAFARLTGGFIKGWMLISAPGNETRDARILERLEQSFSASSDRALDPGMVAMGADTKAGLLSGLEVRKPRLSRSGFYVSGDGAVLTTVDAVASCGRVTLDRTVDATVAFSDAASGVALLRPTTPLAPPRSAEFQLTPERPGSEVMVAGYSYEDRLPAPVMTFGTLEEVTGLNGEADLKRLSIEALSGDVGGPVLDATGAVIGMLLPPRADGGKTLPAGVHFAFAAAGIARLLEPAGVLPTQSAKQGALAPSELSDIGTGMTVLVSCWD